MRKIATDLFSRLNRISSPGSEVFETSPGVWRLAIPAGSSAGYRLAQLDDYRERSRAEFPWQAPVRLSLRVRSCTGSVPGTWGFGLWNDPFSLGSLGGIGRFRFPVLPNAAWFFHASPPNHLTLRNDLPAQGWFAATYRSMEWTRWLLPAGLFALPLLLVPAAVRMLRRLMRRFILQDAAQINTAPGQWHTCQLEVEKEHVLFTIDGTPLLDSPLVPAGRLGLVIWIDNRYLSVPPDGRLRYGTLENKTPAWIEASNLTIQPRVS